MVIRVLQTMGSVLLPMLFLFACGKSTDSDSQPGKPKIRYVNLDPKVEYIGDEECKLCHKEIYESFKQNGMGRSFYPLTAENIIEDFSTDIDVYDEKSNYHYEAVQRNDGFYQIEYRLDENGKRTHELAVKIDYVIGSGKQARTYVTEENGFYYEMPLTWYSLKKKWDLSPGYRHGNYRFKREIPAECMNCHNSYAQYTPYSGNRFTEVPHGIGCERCHGPGEAHVDPRFVSNDHDSTQTIISKNIVNPRDLPPEEQIDVCFQCHLQGAVSILKPGKEEDSFRPGMRLKEVKSVFVHADLPPGDLRVASHGQRFSLSECYIKSNGAFTCISCHNPHLPVESVPKSHFNQTCLKCHEPTGLSQKNSRALHTSESDCISCHMPQGGTSDVAHVNFTDHWIQKEPGTGQTSGSNNSVKLVNYFEPQSKDNETLLGMAYLEYYGSNEVKAPEIVKRSMAQLEERLKQDPDNQEALYRLGSAYLRDGNLVAAFPLFNTLTQIAPENALAHLRKASVLNRLSRYREAIVAHKTALELLPDNALALTQLGYVYVQLKRPTEAFDCFVKAAEAQPSYAQAHNALGEYYLFQKQDKKKARKYFQYAIKLDPDYIDALSNLGDLAIQMEDYEAAASYYDRTLKLNPKFLKGLGELAFVQVTLGHFDEARSLLNKAKTLAPADKRIDIMFEQLEKTENASKNR